jgi:hypothetical protein
VKFYAFVISAFLFMLAGCAGAGGPDVTTTPPPSTTSQATAKAPPEEAARPTRTQVVEETPASTQATEQAVTVEWELGAAPVITATYCCGLTPDLARTNYLPEALVQGDGIVRWVEYNEQGGRQVLQGELSQVELSALLQPAVDAGFFEWEEMYSDRNSPSDLPTKCLEINLKDAKKRVCEYYQGAPEAFHSLYNNLTAGAGLEGTPYQPERAYLAAQLYPGGVPPEGEELPQWDAAAGGITLEEVVQGAWVEGPALQTAWEAVNANPMAPIIEEDGKLYGITIQIPGYSLFPPPEE